MTSLGRHVNITRHCEESTVRKQLMLAKSGVPEKMRWAIVAPDAEQLVTCEFIWTMLTFD